MEDDITRRISQLQSLDVYNLLKTILNSLQGDIELFNKFDQLYEKGIKTDGSPVMPPYTPLTKFLKGSKGQRIDHVTLRDTGDFYAAWFIKLGTDAMTFGSDDGKRDELIEKYTKEIFGLTDESLDKLREKVKPLMIEKLDKHFS